MLFPLSLFKPYQRHVIAQVFKKKKKINDQEEERAGSNKKRARKLSSEDDEGAGLEYAFDEEDDGSEYALEPLEMHNVDFL